MGQIASDFSLEILRQVAQIANMIPCADVHPAGAPCFRCNPTTTVRAVEGEDYTLAPDYMIIRLRKAVAMVEAAMAQLGS